jgi:acyl carrier protein phosphodiesterase
MVTTTWHRILQQPQQKAKGRHVVVRLDGLTDQVPLHRIAREAQATGSGIIFALTHRRIDGITTAATTDDICIPVYHMHPSEAEALATFITHFPHQPVEIKHDTTYHGYSFDTAAIFRAADLASQASTDTEAAGLSIITTL